MLHVSGTRTHRMLHRLVVLIVLVLVAAALLVFRHVPPATVSTCVAPPGGCARSNPFGNAAYGGHSALTSIPAGGSAAQPAGAEAATSLLSLINRDRRAAHLPALHGKRILAAVALAHSLDMARGGYLSHWTPAGASPYDRLSRAGIGYLSAGENLGYDADPSLANGLQAIEAAMLRSPEHRANLLRARFTHVGIGIALAGDRIFVTEDFAQRPTLKRYASP